MLRNTPKYAASVSSAAIPAIAAHCFPSGKSVRFAIIAPLALLLLTSNGKNESLHVLDLVVLVAFLHLHGFEIAGLLQVGDQVGHRRLAQRPALNINAAAVI